MTTTTERQIPAWATERTPKHVMYRCAACKFVERRLVPRIGIPERTRWGDTVRTRWWDAQYGRALDYPPQFFCPNGCESYGQRRSAIGKPLVGRYSASKKCGARCLNAVGPSCECQCGGKNHGGGHDAT